MAKLNPTLKLISSTTAGEETSSDALAFTVTDELTVTQPMIDVAQLNLSTSVTNIIPETNSAIVYFYAKNTSSTQTVVFETITGTQAYADLSPGEWCFFPVKGAIGLRAKSAASTAVLEYGYWSKS